MGLTLVEKIAGRHADGLAPNRAGRRLHRERGVRPSPVVILAPVADHHARLGQAGELLAVEQLVPDAGVERLHERVLPRRARLDVAGLRSR